MRTEMLHLDTRSIIAKRQAVNLTGRSPGISRVTLVAAGIALGSVTAPVSALNGDTYVISCACKTTAEFSGTASNMAATLGRPTWFSVISTVQPSTAYMRVTGKYVTGTNGEPYWTPTTTTPVDGSGNSLAGSSESTLQTFYNSADGVVFGVSRQTPTQVMEPSDYASSFINSQEAEVVPGIGAALIEMLIDQSLIKPGTTITVKFEDGTTAQYVKAPNTATYQWTWNLIAHDKYGNQIDRAGNIIKNKNTSGRGGGGFSGHALGGTASWEFDVAGSSNCSRVTTITVNGEVSNYVFVSPC